MVRQSACWIASNQELFEDDDVDAERLEWSGESDSKTLPVLRCTQNRHLPDADRPSPAVAVAANILHTRATSRRG